MADALTKDAPLKKQEGAKQEKKQTKEEITLSQKFDPNKKYMFELAEQNIEREQPVYDVAAKRPAPHMKFKPYQNIVLTSQIVWNGERRMIRYYDGCTTIFVDEQPKEKEVIDQYIRQTRSTAKYNFLDGKFGCYGDERMLLLYLNICSWNGESEFRTKSAQAVFIPSNRDKVMSMESKRLDEQEEALKLAKEASETKMFIHANYLGIPTIDFDSNNELTPQQLRIQYRKVALKEPAMFIESYGNKKIEIKYYIDKALEKGLINNKFNPNKAAWANSNSVICDISGIKSQQGISEKLFEFSNLEGGEEFAIQLKALFD